MKFLIFIVETQPILFKDSASRRQYTICIFMEQIFRKMKFLIFIVETQPILSKDSASRRQFTIASSCLLIVFAPLGVFQRLPTWGIPYIYR
jgi:hypothetical protein